MKDEIESIHNEPIFIDFSQSTPFRTDTENNYSLISETFLKIFFTQLDDLTFNRTSLMWSEKDCLEH